MSLPLIGSKDDPPYFAVVVGVLPKEAADPVWVKIAAPGNLADTAAAAPVPSDPPWAPSLAFPACWVVAAVQASRPADRPCLRPTGYATAYSVHVPLADEARCTLVEA